MKNDCNKMCVQVRISFSPKMGHIYRHNLKSMLSFILSGYILIFITCTCVAIQFEQCYKSILHSINNIFQTSNVIQRNFFFWSIVALTICQRTDTLYDQIQGEWNRSWLGLAMFFKTIKWHSKFKSTLSCLFRVK